MTKFTRRIIALSAAVAMLALQAWPAYAVCVCAEPSDMLCCEPAPEPEPVVIDLPAETGCCSEEAEAPAPTCDLPLADAELSFAPEACEQDVVSANIAAAALPFKSLSITAAVATNAATTLTFSNDAPSQPSWYRAPPPRSVPQFILNAAILI